MSVIGQHAPTTEIDRLVARLASLEERVADLQRRPVQVPYSLDLFTVSGAALPGAAANVFKIGDLTVRTGERFVIQGVADIIPSSSGLALTNIRLYSSTGGFLQDGQPSISPGLGRSSVPLPALTYAATSDDAIQIYAYGRAASGTHVWQSAAITCSLLGSR